jgi:hypothetical protein
LLPREGVAIADVGCTIFLLLQTRLTRQHADTEAIQVFLSGTSLQVVVALEPPQAGNRRRSQYAGVLQLRPSAITTAS